MIHTFYFERHFLPAQTSFIPTPAKWHYLHLTVWEVYHALEPDGLEHFVGLHPHPSEKCPVGSRIETVLKLPYQRIGAAVQAAMEEITLRQLLDDYHGDPFFSETNMAYVKKSVQELKAGKGTAHELIDVDDE